MKKSLVFLLVFVVLFMMFWFVHLKFGTAPDYKLSRTATKLNILLSAWTMCFSGLLFLDICAKKNFPRSILAVCLALGIAGDIAINKIFLTSPDTIVQLPLIFLGINICILLAALAAGSFLSRIVEKVTYIIPISLIAGIADIWSVFAPGGVTKTLVAKKEVLNYALLSFPVFTHGIRPLMGGTDFIFAVLYICLSEKFSLSRKRTLILISLSFVLSTLLAVAAGIGIPVLPIMGVLFILFHFKDIKIIDKAELKEAVTGIIIVILMLVFVTIIRMPSKSGEQAVNSGSKVKVKVDMAEINTVKNIETGVQKSVSGEDK